jgi:predicted neuraminidase
LTPYAARMVPRAALSRSLNLSKSCISDLDQAVGTAACPPARQASEGKS